MRFLFVLLLISATAYAQDPLALFRSTFPTRKLGPIEDQTFCWQDDKGGNGNYRGEEHQRLASVTKLFTTALALETFGPQKSWTTTIYRSGTRVHIAGGLDPWFEYEKIFALIQALKDQGVTRITELTFDSNFVFMDVLQEEYTAITPSLVQSALTHYFTTTGKWLKAQRGRRSAVVAFQKEENLDITVPAEGIITDKVTHTNVNPLLNVPGVTIHRHTSKPLVSTLKAMNVMSKNVPANMLWDQSIRLKHPHFVFGPMGIKPIEYVFYNGSGLPTIYSPKDRRDNTATCQAILKLLKGLETKLISLGLGVDDVVGVGTDFGSYRDRFLKDPSLKEAVAAKTGTLKHSSALAGWIESDVPVRFAIINHTTQIALARDWQDTFLSSWQNGVERPRGYSRISVYPVDKDFFD